MKQNYIYVDGIFYYVFISNGQVFVHTGKNDHVVIGRGKNLEEAINEVQNLINS